MEEKTISLMAEIMGWIAQTDEWKSLQKTDPGIQASEERWSRILKEAKAYLPCELYMELSDAQGGEVSAYCDVAILYGMRVASALSEALANPSRITRYWLEKKEMTA